MLSNIIIPTPSNLKIYVRLICVVTHSDLRVAFFVFLVFVRGIVGSPISYTTTVLVLIREVGLRRKFKYCPYHYCTKYQSIVYVVHRLVSEIKTVVKPMCVFTRGYVARISFWTP